MRHAVLSSALMLVAATFASAEPPRGSITIERISDIKYPTSPAWSPDGTRVAFLWDAAGKQDLFVVTPGSTPVALTDFPVDADLQQSDLGAVAWTSNDQILFGKDGQLWTVSPSTRTPTRVTGLAEAGSFTLSANRTQLALVRRGNVWLASVAALTQRQLTSLPEGLTASVPVVSADGRWLAFTASRGGLMPEALPWNGNLVRSFENVTTERRVGIVSAQGGDVFWVPTVGSVSNLQWGAGGTLVYQEVSPDGKTRDIKTTGVGGSSRTIWRDRDERWWSPTGRDARLTTSPDGRQVAFVSDRSGWIHVYVMPIDATSESQARQLTSGEFGTGLPTWSPDGTRIAYHHSAPGNQMERFISVVDVASGHSVGRRHGAGREPRARLLARRHAAGLPAYGYGELARPLRGPGAGGRGDHAAQRLDAGGIAEGRPRGTDAGALPEPPRQEAGARHVDGAEEPRQVTQAPGHRLDSRVGLGSELPRLASRQLPDVLLRQRLSRAAGLRDPHTRLPGQLRLQSRLGHRRAHGPGRATTPRTSPPAPTT